MYITAKAYGTNSKISMNSNLSLSLLNFRLNNNGHSMMIIGSVTAYSKYCDKPSILSIILAMNWLENATNSRKTVILLSMFT